MKTFSKYVTDNEKRLDRIQEDIKKYCPEEIQKYNDVRIQRVKNDMNFIFFSICEYNTLVKMLDYNKKLSVIMRGKWIDRGYEDNWEGPVYKCSNCGGLMIDISNYCPNCGSYMKEDKE